LAKVQEPSCYNTSDGAIDVSITNGIGPWQYLWTHGPTTADINGIPRGNYEIQVTDEYNGCAAARTISITQPDSLLLSVAVTNERCRAPNGSAEVLVTGGSAPYTFSWSTGGTTAAVEGLLKGSYPITVVDKNGCRNEITAIVGESDCEDVVVNTGVSPNGDGMNDYWVISGLDSYPNHVVQLFDKWGDLVFEKRSYDNKWDGRDKSGTPMPDGSYFYVIKLNPNGGAGSKDVVTGTLLVKR
jgi:gliding motility-associated-like protein